MKWRDIEGFLSTMYEEQANDELWRIYLSNPFRDGSFNDFKQKIIDDNKPKEQIEAEANIAAKSALDMLNRTGGDSFGI